MFLQSAFFENYTREATRENACLNAREAGNLATHWRVPTHRYGKPQNTNSKRLMYTKVILKGRT